MITAGRGGRIINVFLYRRIPAHRVLSAYGAPRLRPVIAIQACAKELTFV